MRVAIIHFTAPPVKGGAEAVMAEQASVLARHGHDVLVLAGRGDLRSQGVHFQRIPLLATTHPTQRRIARILAEGRLPHDFGKVVDVLRSVLEAELKGTDAVLVHNAFTLHFNAPLTAALAQLASERDYSRLMVAWTHDIAAMNDLYARELGATGYPWDLFRRPQPHVRYVTISHTRREELLQVWKRGGYTSELPVTVVPNGIEVQSVLALSASAMKMVQRFHLLAHDDILLAPVRITRRKRLEFALEVLAELLEAGRDCLLVVTGPVRGHHPARSLDYLHDLQETARNLGVSDHVVFLAARLGRPLSRREVSDLYSLSSALFLPSSSEGFGLPVLEACLHRLPVVASDLAVIRELVGDGATLFSLEAPASAVAPLMQKTLDGDVNMLRKSVIRKYDWERIYQESLLPLLASIQNETPCVTS